MSAETKYVILPSGNSYDFPNIDQYCLEKNIKVQYSNLGSGGRIYKIPETEISKLPKDETGPYFGDDNSGWSFYDLLDIDELLIEWQGSPWNNITGKK